MTGENFLWFACGFASALIGAIFAIRSLLKRLDR
jgi:undecaprenyl pyrophosphate phosphatase UppP